MRKKEKKFGRIFGQIVPGPTCSERPLSPIGAALSLRSSVAQTLSCMDYSPLVSYTYS